MYAFIEFQISFIFKPNYIRQIFMTFCNKMRQFFKKYSEGKEGFYLLYQKEFSFG